MGRKAFGPKKKKAHDLHHVKKKKKLSFKLPSTEYEMKHSRVSI